MTSSRTRTFMAGLVAGSILALGGTYVIWWLNEPNETTPSFLRWDGDPKTICKMNHTLWAGRPDGTCHVEDSHP